MVYDKFNECTHFLRLYLTFLANLFKLNLAYQLFSGLILRFF